MNKHKPTCEHLRGGTFCSCDLPDSPCPACGKPKLDAHLYGITAGELHDQIIESLRSWAEHMQIEWGPAGNPMDTEKVRPLEQTIACVLHRAIEKGKATTAPTSENTAQGMTVHSRKARPQQRDTFNGFCCTGCGAREAFKTTPDGSLDCRVPVGWMGAWKEHGKPMILCEACTYKGGASE